MSHEAISTEQVVAGAVTAYTAGVSTTRARVLSLSLAARRRASGGECALYQPTSFCPRLKRSSVLSLKRRRLPSRGSRNEPVAATTTTQLLSSSRSLLSPVQLPAAVFGATGSRRDSSLTSNSQEMV